MAGEIIASGRSAPGFVVSRKSLSAIILFLLVISTTFLPSEAVSLLMLFAISGLFVLSGFKVPRGMFFFTLPLLVFIAIGTLWAHTNATYDVAKDYWYTGKSVVAFMTGYLFASKIRDIKILFQLFIIAATLSAAFHLLKFVADPSLLFEPVRSIRDEAGKGYFITVLAVSIIAVCWRDGISLFQGGSWITKFIFALCLISLVLSFSRTFWLSLVLMLLSIYGVLSIKNLKKILLLGALAISFLVFILLTPPSELTGPDATLRGKAAYSIKEIAIRNYVDKKDIAQNWRGFESFRAIQTYLGGDTIQYFTGRGFGTLVDLGIYMKVGSEEPMRYIATLHNGYMYILIKTGLIGLSLYLYFFFRTIYHGNFLKSYPDPALRAAGELLSALSIVILVTTFVIAGLFNKTSIVAPAVLLGSLAASRGCNTSPHGKTSSTEGA